MTQQGRFPAAHFFAFLAMIAVQIVATALIVQTGRRLALVGTGARPHVSVALVPAGITPVVVAGFMLPEIVALFDPAGGRGANHYLDWGHPLHIALEALLIAASSVVCARAVRDPRVVAADLGGTNLSVAGLPVGVAATDHIARVVARVDVIGATGLAVICLVPELVFMVTGVPFAFPGVAFVIMAGAAAEAVCRFRGTDDIRPSS